MLKETSQIDFKLSNGLRNSVPMVPCIKNGFITVNFKAHAIILPAVSWGRYFTDQVYYSGDNNSLINRGAGNITSMFCVHLADDGGAP